jgi:hypothetical protein
MRQKDVDINKQQYAHAVKERKKEEAWKWKLISYCNYNSNCLKMAGEAPENVVSHENFSLELLSSKY